MFLTTQQEQDCATFRSFVDAHISPYANQFDQEERTPIDVIAKVARQGYLGATLPTEYGGSAMDMITFGLLNEEFARGCSSLRSLLTVQGMVAHSLLRWGNARQKQTLLPKLAAGDTFAAFALSEPNVGSDANGVETTATVHRDGYLLNGRKKWMTYGQIADIFLLFAQCEGKHTAFLVEADRPGLSIEPIRGLLGVRASMVAELHLTGCFVPRENVIGQIGFGFSHVASTALDYGRYSVAWGCVGIAQGALEASIRYADQRKQYGKYLKDYQLIQQMITEMIVNVKAARLLCYQAGSLKNTGDSRALVETMVAKYFASTMAARMAAHAVQIHGANGCSSDYTTQRYFRDAKIMEIIEGSTQMQQIHIARYCSHEYLA